MGFNLWSQRGTFIPNKPSCFFWRSHLTAPANQDTNTVDGHTSCCACSFRVCVCENVRETVTQRQCVWACALGFMYMLFICFLCKENFIFLFSHGNRENKIIYIRLVFEQSYTLLYCVSHCVQWAPDRSSLMKVRLYDEDQFNRSTTTSREKPIFAEMHYHLVIHLLWFIDMGHSQLFRFYCWLSLVTRVLDWLSLDRSHTEIIILNWLMISSQLSLDCLDIQSFLFFLAIRL